VIHRTCIQGTSCRCVCTLLQESDATVKPVLHCRGQTAEDRLGEEVRVGNATAVTVQLKHLQKCLISTGLMQMQQLWCGISSQCEYVHMLFTFTPRQSGHDASDGLELSYKMPVWET
jgi:hypothetical protein